MMIDSDPIKLLALMQTAREKMCVGEIEDSVELLSIAIDKMVIMKTELIEKGTVYDLKAELKTETDIDDIRLADSIAEQDDIENESEVE